MLGTENLSTVDPVPLICKQEPKKRTKHKNMDLRKHSDNVLKAVPSAPVAMAASCWSFRANSSAKFPETQALLSGGANMLCPRAPGTNLGVHVKTLKKKHSKEGTRIWPWWLKGHDTTMREVSIPQHAKLLCSLFTHSGLCPYGPDLSSLLLAPLAQNFDHLVAICSILFTPICHSSSGRIGQVKWFIEIITCNYYTLLTVPLKV